MRTTLSIDDELLARAKARARASGSTVGRVVEDALRRELARPVREPGPEVPVFRGGTGPQPGIDLTSNRDVAEILDEGMALDRLR